MRATILLGVALGLAACDATDAADGPGGGGPSSALPTIAMPIGAVIDRRSFRDADGDGIGDSFAFATESGKSRGVRYAVDGNGDQRVTVALAPCPPIDGPDGDQCGFGSNGDGRVALIDATRAARPGEYYKGWMSGRTAGSNNNGTGVCEEDARDAPGREQFRTQLKIWFQQADGPDADREPEVVGSCYCNVCPREAGDPGTLAKCNTSQWSIKTSLSDDGACLAPPGTTQVQFAVIALARDRQPDADGALLGPEASGTAVFDRYVFARCGDDGVCDAPAIVDATRWY